MASPVTARHVWLGLLVLGFVTTRLLFLAYPEGRQSTATIIYADYGAKSVAAEQGGRSVYALHAENAGPAAGPGAGTIEYPPLALAWMALPVRLLRVHGHAVALSEAFRLRYARLLRTGLALIDLCGLGLVIFVLRRQLEAGWARTVAGATTYALGGVLLFALLYDRMDLVVGVLLAAALALLLSARQAVWALLLLAIAINFKIVAVLAAPVWVLGSLRCGVFRLSLRRQLLAAASQGAALVGLCAVMFLPFLVQDGAQTLAFLSYHAARGLQTESIPANLLLLLGSDTRVVWAYGSTDLLSAGASLAGRVATAALFLLEGVVVWRLYRELAAHGAGRPTEDRVARACPEIVVRYTVLLLAVGMCAAKVFSPQYLLWLLPLAPLVVLDTRSADRTFQVLVALTYSLTLFLYPLLHDEVMPRVHSADGTVHWFPPTALGLWVITLRNALMVWLTIFLWRSPTRRMVVVS